MHRLEPNRTEPNLLNPVPVSPQLCSDHRPRPSFASGIWSQPGARASGGEKARRGRGEESRGEEREWLFLWGSEFGSTSIGVRTMGWEEHHGRVRLSLEAIVRGDSTVAFSFACLFAFLLS